jgi:hypothetical protein
MKRPLKRPVAKAAARESKPPAARSLDPKIAPGGNFDLSRWQLQSFDAASGKVKTIPPAQLKGPKGYQDCYFFTDRRDGAMSFFAPENGGHTEHSHFPRCELREMNADGSAANWPVSGRNILTATVKVIDVPSHVTVGQIHIGTAIDPKLPKSVKPLLELFYHWTGRIELMLESGPKGGGKRHCVGNVPLGTKFSYGIELDGDGTILITIYGARQKFVMPKSFYGYGMYFKAGSYLQSTGKCPTIGGRVSFYALELRHE